MITAVSVFELHPPGTVIELDGEQFTVGPDGLWRNKFGQIPAGQVTPTSEPPSPAKPSLPPGRMQHGESMIADDLETQIAVKLQELRRHRRDGYATTTDVIRVLEIMETLAERGQLGRNP